MTMTDPIPADRMDAIAIVGMAGRFPGARDIDAFWHNLVGGVESIATFTDEEVLAAGIDPALLRDPNYVRAGAVLEDVEGFDHRFFGYTPREVQLTDPQHRLFMECAWEALEHAGYDPATFKGAIGVFGGAGTSDYLAVNLAPNRDLMRSLDDLDLGIGIDKDQITTRVSYKLNLTGPSVAVQTACSTSLVAVHMACESLLNNQCDMALAGGVTVKLPHRAGYLYHAGGAASPDGHTRAFDAGAQGTMFGSGAGIVVLKRLADAIGDGDTIYAVVKGSAINNDGSAKIGYTAPSIEGQRKVVAEALAVAGVEADTIGYVEAHGTGTALGDPIEVTALTQAYRASTDKTGYCAIGSAKTNIGHLVAAAGVVGLIKAALALKHEQIPATLHYQQPNPAIDFASSPFYVQDHLTEWRRGAAPRRAAVSSFGIGGTNAHAVLEEAPLGEPSGPARPWQLLVLSAKTSTALETMTTNLAAHLQRQPNLNLADVAYTLQVGRKPFAHRRVLVGRDAADAVAALEARDGKRLLTAQADARERPVAFMFPGGGAQYAGMGRELYETEPLYRKQIDRCVELLKPHLGLDLRDYLYPSGEGAAERAREVNRAGLALPALFVTEYAVARLWMAWGVRPQAMIGHSLGEYVAACLAGVMTLADALALVALRGRLFETMPAGAMLSVLLPEEQVRPLLGDDLDLATINAPALCVVSGPVEAIEALERTLTERAVEFSRLHLSIAAHSRMVEAILPEFTRFIETVTLKAPTLPFVSNLTGALITAEEATDPQYWVRHLRQTVRFADGVQVLLNDSDRVLIEVGPGHTLSSLARQHPGKSAAQAIVPSLRHPRDEVSDVAFLLTAVGRLWLAGVAPDWAALNGPARRQRLPLPTYPFERQRHWIEPQSSVASRQSPVARGKHPDPTTWFYLPSWKRTLPLPLGEGRGEGRPAPAPSPQPPAPTHWLIFLDSRGLGQRVAERLRAEGQAVTTVATGQRYEALGHDTYRLNPRLASDYTTLLRDLVARQRTPQTILHCWSLTGGGATTSDSAAFDAAQAHGYYSLLALAQALAAADITTSVQVDAITNGVHEATYADTIVPEKATLLAPLKVMPQEQLNITCHCVDIVLPERGAPPAMLVEQVIAEARANSADTVICYRGQQRLVQVFEPAPLPADAPPARSLRPEGVYLITGGLGRLGLALAEHLARVARARLVLTGRTPLPPREQWAATLATAGADDEARRKIAAVQHLEELGARVLVLAADVANERQMREVVQRTVEHFGALHGVIHAAGVIEGGAIFRPITEIGTEDSERQFRPKVHGVYVLEKVLAGRALDFRQLVSSNAAILGGLGHVAYSAGNEFLDAFATQRGRTGGLPWISVNWDLYGGPATDDAREVTRTSVDVYAMTPAEVGEVLARTIASATTSQIVVSTGDLNARLDTWIKRVSVREEQTGVASRQSPVASGAASGEAAVAGDEIQRKLTAIWQDVFGMDQIGLHDNFFELGGHSLLAVRLFTTVEQVFGRRFPLATLYEAPTIAELADILRAEEWVAPWSPVVAVRGGGTRPSFFCVHGAGGNVLNFRDMARHLSPDQPVYGIQALGLDGEQTPFDRLEEMAAHYVKEMRSVQPTGPYYLGGYCLGGLVAWEMAQQLQAQGERVALLAMFETYTPAHEMSLTFRAHWTAQRLKVHLRTLRQLSPGEMAGYLRQRTRTLVWRVKTDLNSRAWQVAYRVSQRLGLPMKPNVDDLMEVGRYAMAEYDIHSYAGRPILFIARDRGVEQDADPQFGWGGLASDGLEIHEVPGDHNTMFGEPHVQVMAERLQDCLDRAQALARGEVVNPVVEAAR